MATGEVASWEALLLAAVLAFCAFLLVLATNPTAVLWSFPAVLIAFVLFEPRGLYGRWLKLRTWFQLFPFYRKGLFKRQKSFQKSDRLK